MRFKAEALSIRAEVAVHRVKIKVRWLATLNADLSVEIGSILCAVLKRLVMGKLSTAEVRIGRRDRVIFYI